MAQPFILIYKGANLMGETANVVKFDQMKSGTIDKLLITVGAESENDTIFNLLINGVAQFSGGGRPKILAGQRTVKKENLSIEISEFDDLSIDLESGGCVSPVQFGFVYKENIWIGTQAEYDALDPNDNTLYFIEE